VVSRAGLEPYRPVDHMQVIDFTKMQKRSNRSFRRFEVHSGYTGYEFFSSDPSVADHGNDLLPFQRTMFFRIESGRSNARIQRQRIQL
jgi:hypothetical protein